MQSMLEQRICSSVASGIATATRLLEKQAPLAVEGEDEAADRVELENLPEIPQTERFYLEQIVMAARSLPPAA